MAEGDTAVPLLDDEGWSDVESLQGHSRPLSVEHVFTSERAIHLLQTKGLARLGEFKAPVRRRPAALWLQGPRAGPGGAALPRRAAAQSRARCPPQPQDHLVFPAFQRDPLLTLGAPRRDVDYEAEWRAALTASHAKRGGREAGAPSGRPRGWY